MIKQLSIKGRESQDWMNPPSMCSKLQKEPEGRKGRKKNTALAPFQMKSIQLSWETWSSFFYIIAKIRSHMIFPFWWQKCILFNSRAFAYFQLSNLYMRLHWLYSSIYINPVTFWKIFTSTTSNQSFNETFCQQISS